VREMRSERSFGRRQGVLLAVVLIGSLLLVDAATATAVKAPVVKAPVWSRSPGTSVRGVTVGYSGTVFVTGTVGTTSRYDAMMVARYSPRGHQRWSWSWRRHAHDRWASGDSVAPAPEGVYAGGTSGYGEGGKPFVVRLSASGHLKWRRSLPNPLGIGIVKGLASDRHGVVAAVETEGCCAMFDHDGYLIALDPTGHVRWRTDFEVPGITGTWDRIAAVAMRSGGGIFTAGSVDRSVWSGEGPLPDEDLVVQHLSPTGHELWTRVIDDGTVRDADLANAIAVGGGKVLVGAQEITRSTSTAWVLAYSTDGRRLWNDRWRPGAFSAAVTVTIARWGPIYVGAVRSASRSVSTLRRYTRTGTLVGARTVGTDRDGALSGVATSSALYLAIADRLERWPR
jgi:hypothetical protein